MADRGKETPEEAFQRLLDGHPEDAARGDEFSQMARLAQEIRDTWQGADPRPEFEATLRYRFLSGAQPQPRPLLNRFPVLAVRGIATLLLAMLLLAGLFSAGHVASASALPGDTLYSVKRGIEATRLALPFENKTDLRLALAVRRMKEIEEEQRRGRELRADLLLAMANQTDHVVNAAVQPEATDDLRQKLAKIAKRQQEVLREVAGHAPEEAQEALAQAMEVSQRGHERALEVARERSEATEKPAQRPKEADPTKTKEAEKEPTRVVPTAKPKESSPPQPSPSPSPSPRPTPRPSPTIPSDAPKPYFRVSGSSFELEGRLVALAKDRLIAEGKEIRISSDLREKLRETKIGVWVSIKGTVKQDGSLVAQSISVKSGQQESEQGHSEGDKGPGDNGQKGKKNEKD